MQSITLALQNDSLEQFQKFSKQSKPLLLDQHLDYLCSGLKQLPSGFIGLDASQPWLCFWILHSLDMFGQLETKVNIQNAIQTLATFQNEDGGFAGGNQQLPHLAPTFASIMTLISIGTPEAFQVIDRQKLYTFLMSLKQPDGSFLMHQGGEVDIRGIYCALAVAKICNILTKELSENCANFIGSCQTYEGGLGGCPGNEAHGGYTFCGVAALMILEQYDTIDIDRLQHWVSLRQMPVEGGFQGRTNKLADSCYSFWQAAVFDLLQMIHQQTNLFYPHALFSSQHLEQFLLNCAQKITGGLTDRYSHSADYYHTCYGLSGLSIARYHYMPESDNTNEDIQPTHPVYNCTLDKLEKAFQFFSEK